MKNNMRFIGKRVNGTILTFLEDVRFTDKTIMHFTDIITLEKATVLFPENSSTVKVFNEIFPLSAFGV